jgi:hypothetical protein
MKLKIIDCTDPHMWYSNRIGETVECIGEENDFYWSREDGYFRNIVYKKDAILINNEKVDQMYKYQNEEMMEPMLETRHNQFTGQDRVVKSSELERLFLAHYALGDDIHKCLDQLTDRLSPVLTQELPSQEKMVAIPTEFSTKLNAQVQGSNDRLEAIVRRINILNDRVSL